jgi:hypothetical protein
MHIIILSKVESKAGRSTIIELDVGYDERKRLVFQDTG